METTQKTEDHARDQARAQLDGIIELIDALQTANNDGTAEYEGEEYDEDGIRQLIQEDPLSVEVRCGWHMPGGDAYPEEFCILLCTGGPAVRIVGDLGSDGEPLHPRLEYQDWGTPWTRYRATTTEEDDSLLAYCREFYFGD